MRPTATSTRKNKDYKRRKDEEMNCKRCSKELTKEEASLSDHCFNCVNVLYERTAKKRIDALKRDMR